MACGNGVVPTNVSTFSTLAPPFVSSFWEPQGGGEGDVGWSWLHEPSGGEDFAASTGSSLHELVMRSRRGIAPTGTGTSRAGTERADWDAMTGVLVLSLLSESLDLLAARPGDLSTP